MPLWVILPWHIRKHSLLSDNNFHQYSNSTMYLLLVNIWITLLSRVIYYYYYFYYYCRLFIACSCSNISGSSELSYHQYVNSMVMSVVWNENTWRECMRNAEACLHSTKMSPHLFIISGIPHLPVTAHTYTYTHSPCRSLYVAAPSSNCKSAVKHDSTGD